MLSAVAVEVPEKISPSSPPQADPTGDARGLTEPSRP